VRGASESRTYPLVAGVIRHEAGLYTLPTLFSEYINDLAENINELACVVKFNEETTNVFQLLVVCTRGSPASASNASMYCISFPLMPILHCHLAFDLDYYCFICHCK
jgi:hypothetical protein